MVLYKYEDDDDISLATKLIEVYKSDKFVIDSNCKFSFLVSLLFSGTLDVYSYFP
jgi:hypothetical protein